MCFQKVITALTFSFVSHVEKLYLNIKNHVKVNEVEKKSKVVTTQVILFVLCSQDRAYNELNHKHWTFITIRSKSESSHLAGERSAFSERGGLT